MSIRGEVLRHSWLRQGLDTPWPWGSSTPEHLLDTEVTFYRFEDGSDNGIGGTGRGTIDVYLEALGASWTQTETGLTNTGAVGPVLRRYMRMIVPITMPVTDNDLLPRKGDRCGFLDTLGRSVDVAVTLVNHYPNGDFVEVELEEYT